MADSSEQINILKRLQQAYEEENLTLFVGAGVSKTVPGSKAKLWSELVKEMQDFLKSDDTDPLRLAQMLFNKNKKKYMELTHNSIDDKGNTSSVHQLIAKLKPRIVITTNWDCLLEKALLFPWYDIITCDEELLNSQRGHKLIKMHGGFARGDEQFVFKEDDYLNYSHKYPLIETFIKNTLVTTNVLFIGYSYSDINLKMIMTWLRQNRRRGDYPLHVIAQYEAKNIQKKYFLNWGIKTYVCKDAHKPEDTLILSDDKKHRSYRLYNFLNEIYLDKKKALDIDSLWKAYEPFMALPSVPYKLITDLLPKSEIICYQASEPFLNLLSDPKCTSNQTLYEHLKQYADAKKHNDENALQKLPSNIGKIVDFWVKAGISHISFNALLHTQPPSESISFDVASDTERSYLDYVNDIEDWLSFKKTIFDESYNEQEHIQSVISLFKERKLAESLIENSKLHAYHQLNSLGKQNVPDLDIGDVNEIIEILPRHLQKIYSVLADVITFKDIKDKSQKLYAKIHEKLELLNQRKNQVTVSFNNTDSFLERAELLNFLRFFWLNNLFVEYYKEVHEYVYLSLKYTFSLHYCHYLSCVWGQDDYRQRLTNPPAILLKRFELSALLHFVKEKKIEELLDKNTYLLDGPLKLALRVEDIDWLVDEVLPNLVPRAQQPKNILDGTSWEQRIGHVFKLLANVEKIEISSLKKILDFIEHENIILDEPFCILRSIVLFFNRRQEDMSTNPELATVFIESFLKKAMNYLKNGISNQHPRSTNSMLRVCELVSCFSPTTDKIPDDVVDTFMECYLSMDLRGKCTCIQGLSWIFNVANDDKKIDIKVKIDTFIEKENNHSVMYEIFKVYLVLIHMHDLTMELLTGIFSNEDIRPQPGSWNSDTNWLVLLLNKLKSDNVNPALNEQLEKTIRVLLPVIKP